jgi:hypothetical protein
MLVTCADPGQLATLPLTKMLTPRFASGGAALLTSVSPDVEYGGCSSHGAYCVYGWTGGELENYYQYQGTSSFTGHVRSGRGGTCSAGSLLANSSNYTLSHDQYIALINYDYTLDSTYSDENVTSGGSVGGIFCENF